MAGAACAGRSIGLLFETKIVTLKRRFWAFKRGSSMAENIVLDDLDKTLSMDQGGAEDRIAESQGDDVLLTAFADWADAQDAEGSSTLYGGVGDDSPLFDVNDVVRDGGDGLDVLIGDGAVNAVRN